MKNKQFRTIEKFLYNQRQLEKAIREAREELTGTGKKGDNVGGGKTNSVGDPTGSMAIKLASPLKSVVVEGLGTVFKPETWVKVMDDAYAAQDIYAQKLLRARYYDRKAKPTALAIDFHIGETTAYDWCKQFVWEVVARAAAAGLIRFDK